MSVRKRNDYLSLRRQFTPEIITLIAIAESPPASGLYFYDQAGAVSEPLFSAMMKHHSLSPDNKENGLRSLQRIGWVLVDATYEAVNKLGDAHRDRVIARDYQLLRDDLEALLSDRSTPVLLIKANVCRILEPKLLNDGFNVINRGQSIYFPSTGRQAEFHRQLQSTLSLYGIR